MRCDLAPGPTPRSRGKRGDVTVRDVVEANRFSIGLLVLSRTPDGTIDGGRNFLKIIQQTTFSSSLEWIQPASVLSILSLFISMYINLRQGCPVLVLNIYCPEEFSSNPNLSHLIQVIKTLERASFMLLVFWSVIDLLCLSYWVVT